MSRLAPQRSPAARGFGSKGDAKSECLAAFQKEFDYLCRTLRRLGVQPADVEDLVHEVFLLVHHRWHQYDPQFPLRPWLFAFAFRVASAHRRRRGRELPHAFVDIEDSAPRPDQAIASQQARSLVLAALEKVPLPRRAVMVMHDIDSIAMHEIAAAMSIPLFTAYSRLRKARKEFEAAVRLIQKRVGRS